VRQVSSLALPAYLASAASTVSLQKTIFEAATCPEDAYGMSKWFFIPGTIQLSHPLPAKQSFWDAPNIAQIR